MNGQSPRRRLAMIVLACAAASAAVAEEAGSGH
jgi:hypothetical protein